MEKFRNIYRIDTTRLPIWDYAREAAYFITICTKNKSPFFGEIKGGNMYLSKIEEIIDDEWKKQQISVQI